MALKKDQSKLPAAAEKIGMSPDPAPRFVTRLAQAWYDDYLGRGEDSKPMSIEGRAFRASWASSRCARALAYNIAGVEPTNPPQLADAWRFGLGSMVHDSLQAILTAAFPGCRVEVAVDLRPDLDGAASVDIVIDEDNGAGEQYRTVIELKTINGFGFKMAVGARGPAEGPRFGAIVQGALAAHALNADELIVGYLSLENLSPREADKIGAGDVGRFAAEWSFTKEQIEALAMGEHARVNRVLELMQQASIDADGETDETVYVPKAVPRAISDPETPKGARVTDPATGAWQVVQVTPEGERQVMQAGKTWMCGYCWNRDRCLVDGA